MGKNARLKAKRRAQREALAPFIEKWSQVPSNARYGMCDSSTCTLPNCLDPWVTHHEIFGDEYAVMVVMGWTEPRGDVGVNKWIRINGEDLGVVPDPGLPEREYESQMQAFIAAVTSRFGKGAMAVVTHHLLSRAENFGQISSDDSGEQVH